jgi:hypothetical protein
VGGAAPRRMTRPTLGLRKDVIELVPALLEGERSEERVHVVVAAPGARAGIVPAGSEGVLVLLARREEFGEGDSSSFVSRRR